MHSSGYDAAAIGDIQAPAAFVAAWCLYLAEDDDGRDYHPLEELARRRPEYVDPGESRRQTRRRRARRRPRLG